MSVYQLQQQLPTTTNCYQSTLPEACPKGVLSMAWYLLFVRLASSHVCLYYYYNYDTTNCYHSDYTNKRKCKLGYLSNPRELLAHTHCLARGLPQRLFCSAMPKSTRQDVIGRLINLGGSIVAPSVSLADCPAIAKLASHCSFEACLKGVC